MWLVRNATYVPGLYLFPLHNRAPQASGNAHRL